MNYHALFKDDMVNGEGVRTTLFVGGCVHACKGCYNQSTWSPDSGTLFTSSVRAEIIESLAPDYISGLSLSGGDPLFVNNLFDVLELILSVRNVYGDKKDIWLWSGYTLCEIMGGEDEVDWQMRREIIANVDVFIDGKYEQELRDPNLMFRGSSNQVIHRMKK